MKPSSLPTDPRLFPTELNHTAELDAKALDGIVRLIREQPEYDHDTSHCLLHDICKQLEATGRTV